MTKQSIKKTIALSLVVILLTAVCAYGAITIINHFNNNKNDTPLSSAPNIEDKDGNNIEGNVIDMPSEIFINKIPLAASDTGVSTTLKAVIKPDDAANQNVSWAIEWLLPQEKAVEDYVTLTVSTTDSKIVTVTCLQAFGNDEILITVTTDDGGFKATTKVIFRGYAESMIINIPSEVPAIINKNYEFTITLNNRYNSINYTPIYELIKIEGVDPHPAIFQTMTSSDNGIFFVGTGVMSSEGTQIDGLLTFDLTKKEDTIINGNRYQFGTDALVHTEILNSKVIIKPIALMKNDLSIKKIGKNVMPPEIAIFNTAIINNPTPFLLNAKARFKTLSNNSNEENLDKYKITIRETITKIESSIVFKFVTGNQSVNVDKDVIEF